MFSRQKPMPAMPESPEALANAGPTSIHDLSISELRALQTEIASLLAQKDSQARQDFKRDFIDRMSEFGLTIDDLKPEKAKKERKKRETKPKYMNPDTGEEWSGRGRPPMWMQLFLEQGRQQNEFLITNEGTNGHAVS